MKCEDSLTKIEAYIHNKMSYRELEDFLEHVKECPDCYDELETYYTITVGMKYLEEERLEAYNIPQMRREDLKKKERYVRRVHAVTGALFTGGLIGLIVAAVLMLLYLGRIEMPVLF